MNAVPFVPTSSQQAALDTLTAWATRPSPADAPLGVLVGPFGTGRSRAVRELQQILSGAGTVLLDGASDGTTDMHLLRALVAGFDGHAIGRTGMELRDGLRTVLAQRGFTTPPVVIIDDAAFAGARLELVRWILDDNTDIDLRVLLVGTPDLADRVRRRRSLARLLDRVSTLAPATAHDAERILLAALGQSGRDLIVDDGVVSAVVTAANGRIDRVVAYATAALEQLVDRQSERLTLAMTHALVPGAAAFTGEETDSPATAPKPAPPPVRTSHRSSLATTQTALWEEENRDTSGTD